MGLTFTEFNKRQQCETAQNAKDSQEMKGALECLFEVESVYDFSYTQPLKDSQAFEPEVLAHGSENLMNTEWLVVSICGSIRSA